MKDPGTAMKEDGILGISLVQGEEKTGMNEKENIMMSQKTDMKRKVEKEIEDQGGYKLTGNLNGQD